MHMLRPGQRVTITVGTPEKGYSFPRPGRSLAGDLRASYDLWGQRTLWAPLPQPGLYHASSWLCQLAVISAVSLVALALLSWGPTNTVILSPLKLGAAVDVSGASQSAEREPGNSASSAPAPGVGPVPGAGSGAGDGVGAGPGAGSGGRSTGSIEDGTLSSSSSASGSDVGVAEKGGAGRPAGKGRSNFLRLLSSLLGPVRHKRRRQPASQPIREQEKEEPIYKPYSSRKHQSELQLFKRHVAFPGSEVCGAWADEFRSIQSENVQKRQAGKFLVFEPIITGSGFGDRLNGVVSAFLAALVTKRAFFLSDPFFDAAFEPAEIDWRVPEWLNTKPTTERMSDAAVLANPEGVVLLIRARSDTKGQWMHCPDCASIPPTLVEQFQGVDKVPTIVLQAHWGILTLIFSDPDSATRRLLHDWGMRLPSAFGCIVRYLLRPKKEVYEKVLPTLKVLQHRRDEPRICIHARTIDQVAWAGRFGGQQQAEAMTLTLIQFLGNLSHCAQTLQDWWYPSGKNFTWLLMTDNVLARSYLLDKHPEKIVTSGVEPQHPVFGGNDAAPGIVVDWFLFSMCDYYIFVDSGLSKTAYAYNMQVRPLFLAPRLEWFKEPWHCEPARPDDVYKLRGWSGL